MGHTDAFHANSALFQGAVTSMLRRAPHVFSQIETCDLARFFTMRAPFAPGPLLLKLTASFVDSQGPGAAFDSFANSFCGQRNPVVAAILAAPDAGRMVRRLQAIEQTGHRGSYTAIEKAETRRITLKRIRQSTGFDNNLKYCVGYWGFVVGIFREAGYRNLSLEIEDGHRQWTMLFANGSYNESALASLAKTDRLRISWPGTPQMSARPAHLPFPVRGDPLVSRVALQLARFDATTGPMLRLTDLAKSNGRSPRSLQRHLAASGLSLRDLRIALRMQRASRYIITDDRPLNAVAIDAGFSDAAHLSREFRRLLGITPQNYQQIARL